MAIKNRIWIDVTTLIRWRRPAVGVVRVEEQLARWALDQSNDLVRFCRFDSTIGAYCCVTRRRVARCIELHDSMVWERARKKRKRRRILTLLSSFLSSQPILQKSYRWIKSIAGFDRVVLDADRPRRLVPDTARNSTAGISSGDVYVSVGSDWDDKDFRKLYKYKGIHGFRTLGICYDTIPVRFPDLALENTARMFSRHLVDLAWVYDHVLCISKRTQADFLEFLESAGAPLPETSVIRLGNSWAGMNESSASPRDRSTGAHDASVRDAIARPFVLFVSSIEKRKNHETLYKAWFELLKKGRDVPALVFVGMRGWGVTDLLKQIASNPLMRNHIHILDRVSDTELAQLYEKCLFTVYPSLYEGWGLPVEESFSFGKFCLCSNAGSLPEVGGEFAEYLDPLDVAAWADRVWYFVENPDELAHRNQNISATFKPYAWRETARSILQIAEGLASTETAVKRAPF